MKSISIRQYQEEDYLCWNTFVAEAKNATFLFHRDFMEYHKDRFQDCSLMVFEDKKPIALIPAHREQEGFYTHWGLTYGGILTKRDIRTQLFTNIFTHLLQYLKAQGFNRLFWKEIPHFYSDCGNDEWKFMMYRLNAQLIRRYLTSTIDLRKGFIPSKIIKRHINDAKKQGISIQKMNNYTAFWNEILSPELMQNHHTQPVHSAEEISKLANLFPKNIEIYGAFLNGKLIAGTVLFINKRTVHSQYICGLREYRKTGALDLLFSELITSVYKDYDYFDFGISNELYEGKLKINDGLLFWKEGFGARSYTQDFYELDLRNTHPTENIYL